MKNFKLSVDEYAEDFKNQVFICQCYTPGLTGEEAHIEKMVSWAQLQAHICNSVGKVEATNPNDTQELESVCFSEWYMDGRMSSDMNDHMADVINALEKRTQLAGIGNPFASVTFIGEGLQKMNPQEVERIIHQLRA